MALYKKIYVYLKEYENRLNRTIYVRSDANLSDVGLAIAGSFGAWFEHCWYFTSKGKDYIPLWFEGWYGNNYVYYEKYHLKNLGNNFQMEYDTGEGYIFVCEVLEEIAIPHRRKLMMIESAKGIGIFENDRCSLEGYLQENLTDEEFVMKYNLPMNINICNISKFDNPIDLVSYQKFVDDNISKTRKYLQEEYLKKGIFLK